MDIPEVLLLQAIDQLTLVARRFESGETTDWRAKNAARLAHELKAHHERQSAIVAKPAPKRGA